MLRFKLVESTMVKKADVQSGPYISWQRSDIARFCEGRYKGIIRPKNNFEILDNLELRAVPAYDKKGNYIKKYDKPIVEGNEFLIHENAYVTPVFVAINAPYTRGYNYAVLTNSYLAPDDFKKAIRILSQKYNIPEDRIFFYRKNRYYTYNIN